MVYSGAWGKLNHEKNQKQKISWHCPFKGGKKTLEWTTALDSAFQHSKQVLAAPNTAIAMAKDASNTHIGGALHQQLWGSW